MSIDPAILRAMAAAGASMDVILAAVEAAKAADDACLAERRAKAAAKKARQRAAKKVALSPNVPGTDGDDEGQTGTGGDEQKKSLPDPLKKTTDHPPSAPKGASDPQGGSASRGTRLPADWKPKKPHYDRAAERRFTAEWVDGEADAMREWADANGNRPIARKASWDRTFDGWLRRAMTKSPQGRAPPQHVNGKPKSNPEMFTDLYLEAEEDLRRKRNGDGPFDGETILPFAARGDDTGDRHADPPIAERFGAGSGPLQPQGHSGFRVAGYR